jgi:drug/metabolite transporter (DMT)-like permease
MIISTLMGGFGALFMKKGSAKLKINIIALIKNWQLILGCLLYVAAAALSLLAYKTEKLSVVYPLVGLSYVWVALFSMIFLKEKISRFKWIGITFILIGVLMIGLIS